MTMLGPEAIAPLLDGHVDYRVRAGALQPLRFPAAEHEFYDPFTRWVATCTAGVRIRFTSAARSLRLSGAQRLLAQPTSTERRGAYDLFVDGKLFDRRWATGGAELVPETSRLIGDEAFTVEFHDLPPGDKAIELWLPQAATVSIRELELDGAAAPSPDRLPRILFHGSSISHGMEAEGASNAWPAVASRLAGVSHQNLGWAGSCLLSGLAARIVRDSRSDAIVLKLGINVWSQGMLKERTFADSAHAMISIVREKHVETPFAIISPILSPPREDVGDNGGMTLNQMRVVLERVVDQRRAVGDANIRYISGLDLFGPADARLLPDQLHPDTEGQQLMGERFARIALLGDAPMIEVQSPAKAEA